MNRQAPVGRHEDLRFRRFHDTDLGRQVANDFDPMADRAAVFLPLPIREAKLIKLMFGRRRIFAIELQDEVSLAVRPLTVISTPPRPVQPRSICCRA